MNNPAEQILENFKVIFAEVEDALNNWKGEGCLQFPTLVQTITLKLNWTEKQAREYDPIVRHYVRQHPDWHVTRGARGGIMRITDKQKKEEAKAAKEAAKKALQDAIDAKVAAANASISSTEVDESEEVEDELDTDSDFTV